jgi:hypothetical protein
MIGMDIHPSVSCRKPLIPNQGLLLKPSYS